MSTAESRAYVEEVRRRVALRDLKERSHEARDAFDNGDVVEDHGVIVNTYIRVVIRALDELDRAIAEELDNPKVWT